MPDDTDLKCEICATPIPTWQVRCTNARCLNCHRRWCTAGGSTSPGHNRLWPEKKTTEAAPKKKIITVVAVLEVPDVVYERSRGQLTDDVVDALSEWKTHEDVGRFSVDVHFTRVTRGLDRVALSPAEVADIAKDADLGGES